MIEALKKDDAPEIIYAGNTLSPYALNQMLKRLKGKSVYIDCIAKNFETLEPGSSFRILREYMEKKNLQNVRLQLEQPEVLLRNFVKNMDTHF